MMLCLLAGLVYASYKRGWGAAHQPPPLVLLDMVLNVVFVAVFSVPVALLGSVLSGVGQALYFTVAAAGAVATFVVYFKARSSSKLYWEEHRTENYLVRQIDLVDRKRNTA
jgi:hypothetical protein